MAASVLRRLHSVLAIVNAYKSNIVQEYTFSKLICFRSIPSQYQSPIFRNAATPQLRNGAAVT